MPKKKPPKKGEKPQSQRFIETAKEVGADQTGEVFDNAVKRIVPTKPPQKPHSVE